MGFKWIIGGVGLALVWASTALGGAAVAAKKDGVEILKDAQKGSAVVATLKKGQSVESLERKGMFWKVKAANGKVGFVSVMSVARSAQDSGGGLAKAIQSAAKEGREGMEISNTRSRSAVMGVRGLDESEETAFAGNVRPNMRSVYAMEDRQVNDKGLENLSEALNTEIQSRAEKRGVEP